MGALALLGCSDPVPERGATVIADVEAVSLAAHPDGGFVWAERESGEVWQAPAPGIERDPVLVGTVEVDAEGQRGLLGVAVDSKGRVYAAWTRPDQQLVVGRLAPDAAIVWGGFASATGANGGRLVFADDETLVIGVGTVLNSAAGTDPDLPNTKLLALDPDGPPDQTPDPLSSGWNNPFGFTVATDGTIWVADNHPTDGDERLQRDDDEPTILPNDSAPTGLARIDDRLYVCSINTQRLDRYIIDDAGSAERAGTVADDCRFDVTVLADGSLLYSTGDRIARLVGPR